MHGLAPDWAPFLPLLFGLLAVLFTNATRWTTPGVCDEPKSKLAAEAAAQDPETAPETFPVGTQTSSRDIEAEEGGENERERDAPPPYQPPTSAGISTSTSTPEPAPQPQPQTETQTHTWMNPKKPPIKSTSAHHFVAGTFFFLLTLTSLVLGGLSIQAATLCHPDGESGTGTKIFCKSFHPLLLFISHYLNLQIPTTVTISSLQPTPKLHLPPSILYFTLHCQSHHTCLTPPPSKVWTLYTLPLSWSTTALSSFLILLRNLWGPKMAQRFPLDQSSVAMGILIAVMFPFVFVGYILGGAAVLVVQACQGVCCGVREGDEVEEGVELEDGRAAEVGILARARESEDVGGEEGEDERVALMGGGKSDV